MTHYGLNVTPRIAGFEAPAFETEKASNLRDFLASARRYWRGLALWFCLCVGVALAYVLLATPQFVGTAQIVLEPRQVTAPPDASQQVPAPTLDSAQADSQVQVLQSERNLRFVFDTLDLANDPDLAKDRFDIIDWIQGLFSGGDAGLTPEERAARAKEIAFEKFVSRVTVKRLAQSYALEVSYRGLSAKKAAAITNAIAAAYIRDQVVYNVASAAVQRGADYLQNRISDVKTEEEIARIAIKTGVIPNYVFGHADARIVSAAIVPLKNTYPMTTLILGLSAVFALVSGAGAIVVCNELDRTVRSREQVVRLLRVDVPAVIPAIRKGGAQAALSLTELLDSPDLQASHAIRTLRTLVLTSVTGSGHVAVGFVSSHPRAGRTLIAASVAGSIADAGRPVTLVDADLSNPELSKSLAAAATASLTELAKGERVDASSLQTPINSMLSLLPAVSAGSDHDPHLFLGSRQILKALQDLSTERDLIVDLPALSRSLDAVAVAKSLTGVVVVAAVHKTSLDELAETMKILNRTGVRVLGVVLNEGAA